ncbi:MAG: L-aspartate oxidase [Bacteroidales bacterium]|nr:L-aspartate oxidase [Bacteroidales bacterium]MBN2698008.1 L-aspartate oxidase [Bacteroidales bacterium]
MEKRFDFLVIGSGLGGLSFALKVADRGTVCMITKSEMEETNTHYAQGGIAAVTYEPDSYERHVSDTLIAGDGLCDEEVVRMVVREGPAQIQELIEWGTRFDRKSDGQYDLAKEGGHSQFRILHHKDNTGEEIQRALSERVRNHPNITVLEEHFAVELITQHHFGKLVKRYMKDIECFGAYVMDLSNNKVIKIISRITLIAAGGTGQLYTTTTNPPIATGDGIAMVYRARGIVDHMEFVQFHPTSLYNPGESPSFLISEAVRGFGGILKNQRGEAFMKKYDERESLAPRDIVSRAIDNEMKIYGEDFVYLDCTHLEEKKLKAHFPHISEKCQSLGIDIARDMIPVVPAAHYMCGGIVVDLNGLSSINRLYAVGEASSTGLHGGNRLASNSLIEAIVFADRAAKHSLEHFSSFSYKENVPDWDESGTIPTEEMVLITQSTREVKQIMSNYVGIVRSDLRLERALVRLEIIYKETEALYKKSRICKKICELRNLVNVGYLVIKMAQARKESRGLHYNLDYPKKTGEN